MLSRRPNCASSRPLPGRRSSAGRKGSRGAMGTAQPRASFPAIWMSRGGESRAGDERLVAAAGRRAFLDGKRLVGVYARLWRGLSFCDIIRVLRSSRNHYPSPRLLRPFSCPAPLHLLAPPHPALLPAPAFVRATLSSLCQPSSKVRPTPWMRGAIITRCAHRSRPRRWRAASPPRPRCTISTRAHPRRRSAPTAGRSSLRAQPLDGATSGLA